MNKVLFLSSLIVVSNASAELSANTPTTNKEDSIYYNYIGVGGLVGVTGDNDQTDFGLGIDLNAGYLINPYLFTNSYFRITDLSVFSDNNSEQFHSVFDLKLGVKKNIYNLAPFAFAEIELNNLTGSYSNQSWMNINAGAGIKSKMKLVDQIKFFASGDIKVGISLNGQEIEYLTGLSVNAGAILFDKVSAYIDLNAAVTLGELGNSESVNEGIYQAIAGLRYVY
ncbi:MAG: hypothetical protein HRU38_16615 [Saccharospirillaceae bacterium]|nr:hypothetical protein [Saccharospirillaceae bacterium]